MAAEEHSQEVLTSVLAFGSFDYLYLYASCQGHIGRGIAGNWNIDSALTTELNMSERFTLNVAMPATFVAFQMLSSDVETGGLQLTQARRSSFCAALQSRKGNSDRHLRPGDELKAACALWDRCSPVTTGRCGQFLATIIKLLWRGDVPFLSSSSVLLVPRSNFLDLTRHPPPEYLRNSYTSRLLIPSVLQYCS